MNDLGICCCLQRLKGFHLEYVSIRKLARMYKVCVQIFFISCCKVVDAESCQRVCLLEVYIVNS